MPWVFAILCGMDAKDETRWGKAQFTNWRTRSGFNKKQAAEALGVDRDTIRRIERGLNPIDTRTRLACMAISLGLR